MRTAETARTDRFVLSILALSLLLNVILALGLVRLAMMPRCS